MAKTYNQKIDINTAWGGDLSTSGLPVAGNRVQEFIKDEFKTKVGAFYRPEGGSFVYCFATPEDRNAYSGDPENNKHLIIDSYETESKFNIEINYDTLELTKSVIAGTTGNTVGFQFKIVNKEGHTADAKASITFVFRSSNIVQKYTTEVSLNSEGWTTVVSDVIDKYLRNGKNTIEISITGILTNASTNLYLTYNIFDLEYECYFAYNTVKTERVLMVPYFVKCTEEKHLEFFIDGFPVNSREDMVIPSGERRATATIDVPNLSDGQHTLQARSYVLLDEGNAKFYSKGYYYTFAVGANSDTSFLMEMELENKEDSVAVDGNLLKINATQFEEVSFNWSLYDKANRRINVIFEYDTPPTILQKAEFTSNGKTSEFSFRPMTYGEEKPLRVYAFDTESNIIFEHTILIDVKKGSEGVNETLSGLKMKLSAVGRRNSDEDKDVWECSGYDGRDYHATFHGFAWNKQQGWDDEHEALVISDDAYVEFDIQPLKDDLCASGGTIEIELETFDVEDENALICECMTQYGDDDYSGYFRITATEAEFSTNAKKKISTRYKDNERLKIAFICNPTGTSEDSNFMFIVVNGVLERAALFENSNSIQSESRLRIGTGNGGCKVRLYSIRVYGRAINIDEEFNNFVVDSKSPQIVYERNNVFIPGTTDVGFDEVANKLPVMIFTGDMDELIQDTAHKDWHYMDVEYINRQDPSKNFVSFHCQMKLQGTSSLGYPRKNFKLKTKDKEATEENYLRSNYEIDMENTTASNRMLRNKVTGELVDFADYQGQRCFTFSTEGNVATLLKKGKYSFKDGAHKTTKWTLKADYMESSCSHNVGAGRSWNKIFRDTELSLDNELGYQNNTYNDTKLVCQDEYSEYVKNGIRYKIPMNISSFTNQKKFVCRTDAQKICAANPKLGADYVRTAVDGFPMVCFYRKSHKGDGSNLVFMGQYNFINDKASYEVFGFEDIEDPDNETDQDVMVYDATMVECWEGLKNTNPISMFKTLDNWDDPKSGWSATFESRYPELKPEDQYDYNDRIPDASTDSSLYKLCSWVVSTRHEDDTEINPNNTITIDARFAKKINRFQYAYPDSPGVSGYTGWYYLEDNADLVTVEDNAENRQKKFEVEKWEHFDVWKLAGYYIYLMRYGAVDQFVKNTMMFTDGNGRYDNRTDNAYRKWFFINYDNDCLFGLRNNGELAFHWDIDRQTTDNPADVTHDESSAEEEEEGANIYAMMGHDSTLWNNLEADEEFMRMVKDLDNSMTSKKTGLTYDNMVYEFDTTQTEMWCERIYNSNERYKYLYPAKGYGDMGGTISNNLWMLQGTRRSHRHWWIANRFNLLNAKWLSGNYRNTRVQIKSSNGPGVKVRARAGADYYFAWGEGKRSYETNIVKKEGEEIIFQFATASQGDPIYIYAVNKMSEIDFSELAETVVNGSFEFIIGDKNVVNTLKKVIIGNPNSNPNTDVNGDSIASMSCLYNLEYLDITNFAAIDKVPFEREVTVDGVVEVQRLSNLHTLKAFGSGLSEFKPIEGSRFELVELPDNSIKSIYLKNIKFDNIDNFKYNPTTGLQNLYIENNSGLDNSYYNKLVLPWLTKLNNSTSCEGLYERSSLTLLNVNWVFNRISSNEDPMEQLRIFKNFVRINNDNFTITGTINLSGFGSLSDENIEEIKGIFGPNCFDPMSNLTIITPISVFIRTENNSMVAGQTNTFTRDIYPSENAANYNSIQYYVVKPYQEGGGREIVDYRGIKYTIVENEDLDTIREGLTIETVNTYGGKQIGILSTVESGVGINTDIKVACVMYMVSEYDKASVCDFRILGPTYATNSSKITGPKTFKNDAPVIYTMKLVDSNGRTPIGTVTVNWNVTMNHFNDYIVEYYNVNDEGERDVNGHNLMIVPNPNNQPDMSEVVTITANVHNGNNTDLYEKTFEALLLNENVIMTSVSNPGAWKVCSAWTSNEYAMTKAQAAEVTDIGTLFSSVHEEFTFDEFKYFVNVTTIPNRAFEGSGIKEITFPNSITSIGEGAFFGCYNLEKTSAVKTDDLTKKDEYTLPNITVINDSVFMNCESFNKLIVPSSVTEIKNFAFGNTGFLNLLVDSGSTVFTDNDDNDGNLVITDSVTTIGGDAFETVRWNGFARTNKLRVFSIPDYADLSEHLEVLYGRNITEYRVKPTSDKYLSENGVLYDKDKKSLIKYPAKGEHIDTFVLGNSVQLIRGYAFMYVSCIDKIVLPASITTILTHGFDECSVKEVDMESCTSLTKIPEYCFKDCNSLTDIKFANGVLGEIEYCAFYNCPSLTGFTIPSSVFRFGTTVSGQTNNVGFNFYNCGFSSLTVPNGVTQVGKFFVSRCSNLEYIKLPDKLQMSQTETIAYCNSLSEIVLPAFSYYDSETGENVICNENLYTASLISFIENCPNLERYSISEIDNSLTHIIYDNCLYKIVNDGFELVKAPYGITSVEIKQYTKKICDTAFKACKKIEVVDIPDSVTSYGSDSFYGCSSLREFVVGENITEIPFRCFADCLALTSFVVGSNVTNINALSLNGCLNLSEVYFLRKTAARLNGYISYNQHPFGVNASSYAGYLSKSRGNVIYTPYNSVGYDFTGDTIDGVVYNAWVGNPITDYDKCGYSYDVLKLDYVFSVKVYENGQLINDGSIYAVSESGYYVSEGPKIGDEYSFVSTYGSQNLYHGEKLTLYHDAEHLNEIGTINMDYNKTYYEINDGQVLGSRGILGKSPIEDEYVTLSKNEYDRIMANIELLNNIVMGK